MVRHLERNKGLSVGFLRLQIRGGGRSRCRRSWEVLLLHTSGGRLGLGSGHRGSLGLCLAHQFLSARRVLADSALGDFTRTTGVLSSQVPNLRSLLIDNGASILEVTIDQLAVLNVDQWDKEDHGGGDQGETPLWHDLDEPVSDESSRESL